MPASGALSRLIVLGAVAGLLVLAPGSPHAWLIAGLALIIALGVLAGGLSAGTAKTHTVPAAERGAPEARLHAVLDALSAATILVDAQANVVHANAAARAAYPALRPGAPVLAAIRAPAMAAALERLRAGESEVHTDLVERVPAERSFEVFVRPLGGAFDARGAAHAVVFMPETTAARRLEALRVDFVANASHELRTPLASILGFVETLRGAARNDETARERFLGIMEEQARRMARLIEDLLSLSKIEMSEHIPPTGTLDAAQTLLGVVDALSGRAREAGVVIETDFAPDVPAVRGTRDELLRVFENLIENAIKYGRSGGRVRLSLAALSDDALGPAVRIEVQDFGPGIAPEHLPRLTERFYRADVNASRGQGGTGLGLAIVKHILTRHRGRLAISSRLGEGSTFTVLLPQAT